jgi:hypothetical protein
MSANPVLRPSLRQLASARNATASAGAVFAIAVAAGAPAYAGTKGETSPIAFVETTSELDEGRPATSMWNLTDDNDATIWCSRREATGKEAISFTFDDAVSVSAVGMVLPLGKDGATDKSVRRPRVVVVSDVEHRVEVRLKDVTSMQMLELPEPAKGRRVVIEIVETYPGSDDAAPICAAGVGLRDRGRELTGNTAARARGLNVPSRKLLHEWHDDISAPSRTLLFSVDGTFTYIYAPILDDKPPVRLKGKWLGDAHSVVLDVKGKSFLLKTQLTKVASESGNTVELALSGDAPDPSMAATFRPAPLFLPQ